VHRGVPTTASSKILTGLLPAQRPSSNVSKYGAIVGKTNLDEFAMGSLRKTPRLVHRKTRGT
jgi:Asp-tRNA(Asn)/Glu-tRNA(Gln) amidotransferase A subunit family amidase